MEFTVDQYYKLNRLVLSIYGLWPYHSRTVNAWIMRTFTILFLIWATTTQVIKICTTELTADFILDCLPIIIPNIGAIAQFVYRIIINDRLKDLLDQIKTDWNHARSQNEIEIMQTNATLAKITTKWFLLYMFVGISVYMLSTFIPQVLDVFLPLNESRSREHPFHAEFFLDDEKDFYTIRFIMYFGILFVLGVILANGTIFVVYMQHVTGMFTILGYRAELSFNDKKLLPMNQFVREKHYGSVALFVQDHRSILQFVDIIQSCYGLNLFLEFLSLMILIGLTLVQVIKFSGTSDRSIRSAAYITGQLTYMFMYSYMGQQLIDKSTQLSMKIYNARWYRIPISKQRMMLYIMLKCVNTITINAYNIYVLSLESFSAIVQSAVSVCMLLRRV